LFVGWMVDPAASAALAALQELLCPRLPKSGLRWVASADLHLTLRFLGATAPTQADAIASILPAVAACQAPITAVAGPLRWWPSRAAPRTLVLRVASHGALERLAAALDERLSGLGVGADARRFRAHLTLARARALAPQPSWAADLHAPIPLCIDALSLVESAVRDDATRYRTLLRVPLSRD
jgi:RNA 2',3'-cyclic 3'-phosphodiesterase